MSFISPDQASFDALTAERDQLREYAEAIGPKAARLVDVMTRWMAADVRFEVVDDAYRALRDALASIQEIPDNSFVRSDKSDTSPTEKPLADCHETGQLPDGWVIRHYTSEEGATIKGPGVAQEIAGDRQDAHDLFMAIWNAALASRPQSVNEDGERLIPLVGSVGLAIKLPHHERGTLWKDGKLYRALNVIEDEIARSVIALRECQSRQQINGEPAASELTATGSAGARVGTPFDSASRPDQDAAGNPPDGWMMVPKVATEDMLREGLRTYQNTLGSPLTRVAAEWSAMCFVAPKPPDCPQVVNKEAL
jgi:hypothetical protein